MKPNLFLFVHEIQETKNWDYDTHAHSKKIFDAVRFYNELS